MSVLRRKDITHRKYYKPDGSKMYPTLMKFTKMHVAERSLKNFISSSSSVVPTVREKVDASFFKTRLWILLGLLLLLLVAEPVASSEI